MSRSGLWAGRILTALPALMMTFSAWLKFFGPPEIAQQFTSKYGYPPGSLAIIGVLELACVVLYLVPQTAVLGAILMAAYLGGAVSTHVRAGEPWFAPVLTAAVAWLGLYLRDARLRALLPLRRPEGVTATAFGR
jgi:hypothetical protein